jgi:hypothetical protein
MSNIFSIKTGSQIGGENDGILDKKINERLYAAFMLATKIEPERSELVIYMGKGTEVNNAEVIKDWIQNQTEDLDGLQGKSVLKMLIEKFYLQVNDSFTDFL